jgi:hypothetical protein
MMNFTCSWKGEEYLALMHLTVFMIDGSVEVLGNKVYVFLQDIVVHSNSYMLKALPIVSYIYVQYSYLYSP